MESFLLRYIKVLRSFDIACMPVLLDRGKLCGIFREPLLEQSGRHYGQRKFFINYITRTFLNRTIIPAN